MNPYFPFELTSRFLQPTPRVVVVSDSDYKKYQQEQASKELLILESKKNRYETAIAELDEEIKQIQTTAGLLPAVEEATA